MDLKDRKILGLLFQNARLSASKIAKEVGLSKESVRKRMLMLEKTKLIPFFKTNINVSLLGYKKFDVYLMLKTDQEKIINKLLKIKNIYWIGTCFGIYDIRLSMMAKEMDQLIKQLHIIKEDVNEVVICKVDDKISYDSHKFTQEMLGVKIKKILSFKKKSIKTDSFKTNSSKIKSFKTKSSNVNSFKIDSIDKKIISHMLCDARKSFVDIANDIGVSAKVIQYRVNKMEGSLIKSYSPEIDGAQEGFIWAVILVKTKFQDFNLKKRLNSFMSSHRVSAISFLTGSWDLSINLFAKDLSELSRMMNTFKNKFHEDVLSYNPLIIFKKLPKKYSLVL